jgi:hypothetical protein
MRSAATSERRLSGRGVKPIAAVMRRLRSTVARRPVDSLAFAAAVAASLVVVVNALFLQSGAHPAPFFANTTASSPVTDSRPKAAESPAPIRQVAIPPAAQPVAARRNDPIADLIAPSPRVAAVQRALSEFGYGQIKPSGLLDEQTSAAIEKFEREHKLPVTGRVTDRLVGDLAALVGHPLQ